MAEFGFFVIGLLYLVCAGTALSLGAWLLARRAERGPSTIGEASALALGAGWALTAFGLGAGSAAATAILCLANLAWLWAVYRMFGRDERDKSLTPIRPVVAAIGFVELLQLALQIAQVDSGHGAGALFSLSVTLRLLFCVGALMLVHNLYAGASVEARQALGWPAAALGLLWLYDLNQSTIEYLAGDPSTMLDDLRPAAMLVTIVALAIGAMRHHGNLTFRPSRAVTFQSFSLLLIGAYLVAMVFVAQALAYAGGDLARLLQAGLVAVAGALALAVLPSSRLRGWLRVTLSKHLFQHRYDYRAEWLRFTETMGRPGPAAAPLRERIVQALADVTDSPRGLLLTPREGGGLGLDACWQWRELAVPATALDGSAAQFFERTQYILDLDDLRHGRGPGFPACAPPEWLLREPGAWAMVPLMHYERLVGLVVLARPSVARRLDWEDFDVLRVVGRQLASYLAEQASQDALGDATRFEEFHRRIAFVMHDIKNLASQLSLLARNAEKHADKPEFRADMLVTLRNSTDKLQALLDRLGRYGGQGAEPPQPVPVADVLSAVARRHAHPAQLVIVEREASVVMADRDALEQALVHLVQNAIDASPAGTPVFLDVAEEADHAVIEVIDSGLGMSPEFVRGRLFKPFQSSKPGGFGIGAFEARELVRAMGGQLDVESREGLGTRFRLRLPLAGAVAMRRTLQSNKSEVA